MRLCFAVCALFLAACTPRASSSSDGGGGVADASRPADAGPRDAGTQDAAAVDGGQTDAGGTVGTDAGSTDGGSSGDGGNDGGGIVDAGPPDAGAPDAGPRVLLYVTHSAGYQHAVLPHSVDVLREMGARRGWVVDHDINAVNAITPQRLATADAVMFYTTGELPLDATAKANLLAFVNGGGGFIGVHSATDTFYNWPEYGQLIGARFNGHPWHQSVRLQVMGTHPSTANIPTTFNISDEIYQFDEFLEGSLTVVLRLDVTSVNLSASGVDRRAWDFPLSWVRPYGQGRVFYTALGHGAAWDVQVFQQHLEDGVDWALGP